MHLYDSNIPSGNVYKVQLLFAQLGLTYTTSELDILAPLPETRRPEFLAKNPIGRVPAVQLDDGRILAESNAILYYFAEGTPLLAADKFARAEILQWLFFEQYSHEPYIAVLKFWTCWGGLEKLAPAELERLRTRGQQALDVMETRLAGRSFFVDERYGVADIALFAYTQSADAIGLRTGAQVRAWLARVREQPGFVPVKRDPLGKAP